MTAPKGARPLPAGPWFLLSGPADGLVNVTNTTGPNWCADEHFVGCFPRALGESIVNDRRTAPPASPKRRR